MLAVSVLLTGGRARALEPDQIALVVNAKEPAGLELAKFYAQQRHIPDGRILSLDLPTGDDIPFDAYNTQVVPAVRKFLKDNALDAKVTCLVTFYGVPLRISRRTATPAENEELHLLQTETKKTQDRAVEAVKNLEGLAKELDPAFRPAGNDELPSFPLAPTRPCRRSSAPCPT